jgi:hypothetical protein
MIDVTDRSNVDVRLAALKYCGISSCSVCGGGGELLLSPGGESGLEGALVGAKGARCAQEIPSE